MGGTKHKIEEGETLPSIAKRFGFRDWRTIWNDSGNEDLRKLRRDPRILKPGDWIYIPEKTSKEESKPTDARHQFVVKVQKHWLRIILKDYDGRPLANEKYTLRLGNKEIQDAAGADGLVEAEILPDIEEASITLKDRVIRLKVGHLDPVDTESGWQARLYNLGYYYGKLDAVESPLTEAAVEEFQHQNKLKVDGIVGPETQAKLVELHGC